MTKAELEAAYAIAMKALNEIAHENDEDFRWLSDSECSYKEGKNWCAEIARDAIKEILKDK